MSTRSGVPGLSDFSTGRRDRHPVLRRITTSCLSRLRVQSAVALVVLTALPRPAWAEDQVTISAGLSENNIAVGDVVTLEITVTSHVNGSIDLGVPAVNGLTEVSRSKSEGTSISWNGAGQQVTKEYTISIELQAERAGKVTIPPISARVGGAKAETKPLVLNVGGGNESAQAAEPAKPGHIDPPSASERNLFVRYQIDRAAAYVGQQILLDLDVYAAPQANFVIQENPPPPTLDGFWREILDQPQRLTRRIESVGGRSYSVYRLWRIALFPLEAGDRAIPPSQVTFAVNQSIFGGGQRERRKSPPIKIDVRPLPADGRPAAFQKGNVGAYKLSATVDHTQVPAGKAIVLTLSLTGKGNIKSAKLPELGALPGFRVFAPTVSDHVTVDATGISGEKKADILLMPEMGGRLEIPAFELAVFNPELERYERLTTSSIRVVVEGDPSALEPAAARTSTRGRMAEAPRGEESSAGDPAIAKASLRPLRFRSSLGRHGARPWQSALFAVCFGAPPALYLLLIFGQGLLAHSRRETPDSKRKKAARDARHRLVKAKEAADAGDTARAFGEANEALLAFASEKTGAQLRGMTLEEMRRLLESRAAPQPLVDRFIREMETADYARFAPGAVVRPSIAESMPRWEALLSELEAWSKESA